MVRRRPWLPAAIAVTVDPENWAVAVEQAGTPDELLLLPGGSPGGPSGDAATAQAAVAAGVPAGGSRVVYELTAVIAHIRWAVRRQCACGCARRCQARQALRTCALLAVCGGPAPDFSLRAALSGLQGRG